MMNGVKLVNGELRIVSQYNIVAFELLWRWVRYYRVAYLVLQPHGQWVVANKSEQPRSLAQKWTRDVAKVLAKCGIRTFELASDPPTGNEQQLLLLLSNIDQQKSNT